MPCVNVNFTELARDIEQEVPHSMCFFFSAFPVYYLHIHPSISPSVKQSIHLATYLPAFYVFQYFQCAEDIPHSPDLTLNIIEFSLYGRLHFFGSEIIFIAY